jgi:hypothetical protein
LLIQDGVAMATLWLDKARDRVALGKWIFNFGFPLSAGSTKVPGGEVNLLIERFLRRASANDRPCAADLFRDEECPEHYRGSVGRRQHGSSASERPFQAIPGLEARKGEVSCGRWTAFPWIVTAAPPCAPAMAAVRHVTCQWASELRCGKTDGGVLQQWRQWHVDGGFAEVAGFQSPKME